MWFTKCCCCDLRPGALILLMLLISLAVFNLILFVDFSKIWPLLDLIIYIYGYYALIMKKPNSLWPTIGWLIFRTVIDAYQLTINLSGEHENMLFYNNNVSYYGGIVVVMVLEIVTFVIITALKVLTVLVLWSLYKELKEEDKLKAEEVRNQVQLKALVPADEPNPPAAKDDSIV